MWRKTFDLVRQADIRKQGQNKWGVSKWILRPFSLSFTLLLAMLKLKNGFRIRSWMRSLRLVWLDCGLHSRFHFLCVCVCSAFPVTVASAAVAVNHLKRDQAAICKGHQPPLEQLQGHIWPTRKKERGKQGIEKATWTIQQLAWHYRSKEYF